MLTIHKTSEIIHDKELAMINRRDFLSSGCMTHFVLFFPYYSSSVSLGLKKGI